MATPKPVAFRALQPYDPSTLDAVADLTLEQPAGYQAGAFQTYHYVSGGLVSETAGRLAPTRDNLAHPAFTNPDAADYFGDAPAQTSQDYFEHFGADGLLEVLAWTDLGSYFWWDTGYLPSAAAFVAMPSLDYFTPAALETPVDYFAAAALVTPTDEFAAAAVVAGVDIFSGVAIAVDVAFSSGFSKGFR